jgi:hypothetical protein
MKWLLRILTLGLYGREKSRKKMPDGYGKLRVSPSLSATRRGFRKDLKTTFPYITEKELDAIMDHLNNYKAAGIASFDIFVDEATYDREPVTSNLISDSSGSIDCGFCALTGCCGMPRMGEDRDNLYRKDYYILEYLGKKDWEHGTVGEEY